MPSWNVHFETRVRAGDQSVVEHVARAKALATVIRRIPLPPHVQQRLDRLNILRAVQGTTGIEGAELSEKEVEKVLMSPPGKDVLPGARQREEQEVRNAGELMGYVAQKLQQEPACPLTEALICEFHRILTANIPYDHNVPGQYRNHPVRAGTYSPPPDGEHVRQLITEFVEWFSSGPPRGWDPIIRAIVAHFYVISIHPFGDGNGRTSRAVECFLLYQAGINARGFYSLANYYYRNRPEYVEHLDHVRFRSDPDLTPFVLFALRGLVEELEAVHEEVLSEVEVIAFRDFAQEVLFGTGKFGTPVGARQYMFLFQLGREVVPIKALREGKHPLSLLYRNMTTKTLMRDINSLREHGLIIVSGDRFRANLELMRQFKAPGPGT